MMITLPKMEKTLCRKHDVPCELEQFSFERNLTTEEVAAGNSDLRGRTVRTPGKKGNVSKSCDNCLILGTGKL